MTAMAQNIKRMVKMLSKGSPKGAAISVQVPLLQDRIRGDHKILSWLFQKVKEILFHMYHCPIET